MLDEAEIRRRTPLWTALADLFLDGGPVDLAEAIASAARAGGFSAADVRRILEQEVGPVFYRNLLSVAGHWGEWGDDFVREKVSAYLAGKSLPRLNRPLARRIIDMAIANEWDAVVAGIEKS